MARVGKRWGLSEAAGETPAIGPAQKDGRELNCGGRRWGPARQASRRWQGTLDPQFCPGIRPWTSNLPNELFFPYRITA